MNANLFKTGIRHLLRQRAYSVINILGLAIGLACCLLIYLYVNEELTFDRHHANADRIYRIATHVNFGGKESRLAVAPAPMGPTMATTFPEVEQAVRFRSQGSFLASRPGQETIKENRVIFADSTLFHVFTIPLRSGSAATALARPQTIVISRSTASRHFGREEPVGKTLELAGRGSFEVTGVYDDMPTASHFHFDLIASLSSLEESMNPMWGSNNFQTYVLLHPGVTPDRVQAKFHDMLLTYLGPQVREMLGTTIEELFAQGAVLEHTLQPLTDIHLTSDLDVEFEPNGSMTTVTVFIAIAASILIIACINFVNLSTARSARRSREVGIRKVVGSGRAQLVTQFLAESVMLSLVALIVAVGLVEALLPVFNRLAEKSLSSATLAEPLVVLVLIAVSTVVGLLAGAYPAFVLSSFSPIVVLRGRRVGFSSGRLRSVLVVLQYAASVILIVGTIIVQQQVRFTSQKKLGYTKEQVIIINDTYTMGHTVAAFIDEVVRDPRVENGTASGYLPIYSNRSDTQFWREGEQPGASSVSMQIWNVDHNYVPTLGMQVIAGRNFSKEFLSDSMAVVVNRTAAAMYGFDDPIGKRIKTFAYSVRGVDVNNVRTYTIVGVIDDFHFDSMKNSIGALGMRLGNSIGRVSFRFTAEEADDVVSLIERTWRSFMPNQVFSYSFLDEEFARMYQAEKKVGDILNAFALLAVFVACLGLYGLAAFAAEQRTKEIGIRKVLGATSSGIVFRFSIEFARLIAVAFLLAIPAAYYATSRWLEDFVYRIEPEWWIYALAGAAALLIAMLTVGVQAIRAALQNPVESLRYE